MAKQAARQPTTEMRSEQLRPHSVRLSLSLSLLPFASLCLSLRSHLPLSFSRFLLVGIPRRKKGHGPNSKRRERRHAHHGGVRRPSQAVISPASRPTPWATNQIITLSLSLSPFLKGLEDEMAAKLAGPETERGDGDKHACRRIAN